MAVTNESSAPYAPGSAVMGIIERYRERGMTTPFTAEVLQRAGVSESLTPRTLQALQVLDLVDEGGNPTENLESIRSCPSAEYKQRLAKWVQGAYADAFSFMDPSKDSDESIRDAFRSYKPLGQQGRMVSLFLHLCGAAGIIDESVKKESKPRQRKPASAKQKPTPRTLDTNREKHVTGMPPALAGLMSSLPATNQGWPKEQRDKFIATFAAVLDFCYEIREQEPTSVNSDDE